MRTYSTPESTKGSLPTPSEGKGGHATAGIGGSFGARKSSHHNSGSRRSAASLATARTSSGVWPAPGDWPHSVSVSRNIWRGSTYPTTTSHTSSGSGDSMLCSSPSRPGWTRAGSREPAGSGDKTRRSFRMYLPNGVGDRTKGPPASPVGRGRAQMSLEAT